MIDQVTRSYLVANGIRTGTSLENKVARRLHLWKCLDRQQHRVGKYVLDFAWPDKKVALEADGPHHWRPDVAMKDAVRDSWLRAQGWLILRVDDAHGTLDDQLCRAVCVINSQ